MTRATTSPTEPTPLRLRDVITLSGRSKASVYRDIHAGLLYATRPPVGAWTFAPEAVQRYLRRLQEA